MGQYIWRVVHKNIAESAKNIIMKNMINQLNKINQLKLVSAIFYQNFIFSSSDRPSKTMKNVFILS